MLKVGDKVTSKFGSKTNVGILTYLEDNIAIVQWDNRTTSSFASNLELWTPPTQGDTMTIEEQNKLIVKTIEWCMDSFDAIYAAGGMPSSVIEKLTPQALTTLVRNNITFIHTGKFKED